VTQLERIPYATTVLKRYFSYPGDAGVMFVENAYVSFIGIPGGGTVEIKLPVAISISARRRVVIRESEGIEDSIKFVTKSVTADVTLAGSAGNWRKPTMPSVPGVPVIGGLATGMAGVESMIIGTSEYVNKIEMLEELYKKIIVPADSPIKIKDAEGFLAAHDIGYVIPLDYQATPQFEEVAWVMRFVADKDQDVLDAIFPEEK
jgi:hypothetical protein